MSKKSNLKTILSIVAIALCLLNIITFFIPAITTKKEEAKASFSSMEICFTSAESAKDKVAEATKKGDTEAFTKYTILYGMKENEDTKAKLNGAAWLHFVSVILSVGAIVCLALSMFGKNVGLIGKVLVLASLLCMIISLICYCSFLNLEILGVKVSEMYKHSAGAILGLIATIGASIVSFIPVAKKSKR